MELGEIGGMGHHGGNTLSMTSLTWVFPEKDLSISILSNHYGDDYVETALELLSQSGLFTDPQEAPAIPDTEGDVAAYAGTYWDHEIGAIQVTESEGTLSVSVPTLDEWGAAYNPELEFAGLTDVYYLTLAGTPYDITFIADETGEFHWLRNRMFVGERMATLAPGALHADPARFWVELTLAAAEPNRLRAPYGPL